MEITLKKAAGATYFPAEEFLKEVELEIGGQRIDKHYSDWYRIYDELFRSNDEKSGYRRLVDFDNPGSGEDVGVVKRFYVPLLFFFSKPNQPGLALPLISLQYHEVRITATFASETEMAAAGIDTSYSPTATLYCTYIFLDTDEVSLVCKSRWPLPSASNSFLDLLLLLQRKNPSRKGCDTPGCWEPLKVVGTKHSEGKPQCEVFTGNTGDNPTIRAQSAGDKGLSHKRNLRVSTSGKVCGGFFLPAVRCTLFPSEKRLMCKI